MNGFLFSNPWGLLALLAIPCIVAIHFLQRRARRLEVPTVFLVPLRKQATRGGRVLSHLRQNPVFWLQILTALLLAWVLAGPERVSRESVQTVTLVLDSRQSMLAFQDETAEAIREMVSRFERAAARTVWRVLESDPLKPALYEGPSGTEMNTALAEWKPESGFVDAREMLLHALRGAAGSAVVFISDRDTDSVPVGVMKRLVGRPLENVGFVGLTTDVQAGTWRALLRNAGQASANREWWITGPDGGSSPRQTLQIPAGETAMLEGVFEGTSGTLTLHLTEDDFVLDDRLPLTRPRPRPLLVTLGGGVDFVRPVLASLPAIEEVDMVEGAVRIFSATPSNFASLIYDGVAVMARDGDDSGARLRGGAVYAESHPLVEGLDWSGLVVPDQDGFILEEGDRPLVWVGAFPAVFLRERDGDSMLVFNFPIEASNASRLPAFVLSLGRHLERLRRGAEGVEQGNFLLREGLTAYLPEGAQFTLEHRALGQDAAETASLRFPLAPSTPGFFQVRSGEEEPRLEGSSYFAEPRASNFLMASTLDETRDAVAQLRERQQWVDFRPSLWLLLALVAVLGSWIVGARRQTGKGGI